MLKILFTFIFCFQLGLSAQDIVSDLSTGSVDAQRYQELFTETIKVISNSRRIFVISNENQRFTKGDFISLILEEELGIRALVAKIDGDRVGIKILKIYSLGLWSKMTPGREVQVLIGDDSYFKKSEKDKATDDLDSIKGTDDLFKDNLDLEEFGGDDDTSRALRTDNIVSLTYGNFPAINADDVDTNHPQFAASWAYQISDDIYAEALFGYAKIDSFPADDIQTVATTLSLRAKYNFKLPFYSYVMPFVGLNFLSANSPEAGKNKTGAAKDNELRLVEDLVPSSTNFIFGATLLRRLVPAWFLKGELYFDSQGSIHYGVGFAIEF